MAQPSPAEKPAAETGWLEVTVTDGITDAPLPCRAWVQAARRRYYEPAGSDHTPYQRDQSFASAGRFRIRLPAGRATVHVERGKEYLPVDRQLTVKAGQTARASVALKRWIDLPAEGYYSCDVHVHLRHRGSAHAARLALGDDVHLLPVLTYWHHGGQVPAEWPEGMPTSAQPADKTHLVLLAAQELERIAGGRFHSIGAPLITNLTRPVSVTLERAFPPNTDLCRQARKHSPGCMIDMDKPIWAENVVGVAMGHFETAQLCHNHYHRYGDLAVHGGMAGFLADEEKTLGPRELFERTNAVYYRWLNCGFRLAAAGGSAYGVMPVPIGYNRTYAKLDGPLTVANYVKAVRAGRAFATSGPIVTMTADSQQLGATIKRSAADTKPLAITVRVRAIEQLDSLELVHDGRAVRTIDLSKVAPNPVIDRTAGWKLTPKRSGWIAARALYRNSRRLRRQAHTSPIYFLVDGRPIAHKADAEYMIRWIDELTKIAVRPGRFRTDEQRQSVLADYRRARGIYERIARTGSDARGD